MLCLPLCVYPLTFRIAWTTSCWSRMPSSLSEMGSTLPRSNSQRLLQQRVRCDCAATHHHTSRQRLSELHILLWAISCSFPLPTLRMRALLLSHTFTHSLHSTTPLHHSPPLHSTPLTRPHQLVFVLLCFHAGIAGNRCLRCVVHGGAKWKNCGKARARKILSWPSGELEIDCGCGCVP